MATAADSARQPLIRSHLPFEIDGGIAARTAIGVIVLASDQTIEHEFRRIMDLPGVAFYEARIRNDNHITPETLAAMEERIAPATSLILPGMPLDVVAFGCTSASMVIGEEGVFAQIRKVHPDVRCTTPITAAFAAFEAMQARRIAILTPYRDDVNQQVRSYVERRGFEVTVLASFNEEDDTRAARIRLDDIRAAAIELGRLPDVDMVFVSCTNLRLAEAAREIERQTGRPVTSSNHAMAWHCLRLGGVDDALPQWGRLFER